MTTHHNIKNLHRSFNCHSNDDENKRIAIMNELLISNPELLNNFRKRNSKTPCRLRMKSPSTSKSNLNLLGLKQLSPKETKNTKNKYSLNNNSQIKRNRMNKNKSNRNFRDMNTSPLMRHVCVQEDSRNTNTINNKKDKKYISKSQRDKTSPKKNIIVLSRSESFSILDIKKEKESNKNQNDIIIIKKGNIKENEKENNKENEIKKNLIENKENAKFNENFEKSNNDNNINIHLINSPKKNTNINKVNKKIYKIESLSQVGYSGPGILKYNQDNFFVYKNLNDENNVLFIGVCDGHGLVGHDVSKYLINNLPKNLNKELKKTNKYISHRETLYSTMKRVFVNTNKDLCKNPNIDTQFSGSTCVTIILTKNKIISGNVGDSRAVMGRFINGEWINIDLSIDQKPNNPGEKERIIEHGGRIEAYKDENGGDFGPPRVWVKYEDVPGLAMSRSFGDEVAASVGTISEPVIEEFDITNDDKFIIIASDGIWEFISSQECVNIIKDFYIKKDLKGCLKYLLNESSKRWIKEEEVIDDITAVLIFFED